MSPRKRKTTTTPTPAPAPAPEPTPTPEPTPVPAPAPATKYLIKHGYDLGSPQLLTNCKAKVDALPFDGVVVTLPNISKAILSGAPISKETIAAALSVFPTMSKVTRNFIIVYATALDSATGSSAAWQVAAQNMANLAGAIRDSGKQIVGVVYDSERYFGGTDRGTDIVRAQANGAAVGSAFRNVWPAGHLVTFYGPWVSDSRTPQHTGGAPYNDVSWANPLMGPFALGLTATDEAAEVYTLRSLSEFGAFASWIDYLATANPGFMVFDQPWGGRNMDAPTWTSTVRNALAASTRYTFCYTERHDWWGHGWPTTPVPQEWIDATGAARA